MIATIPEEYCPIFGSTKVCVTSVDPRFYDLISTRKRFRDFFKKLLGVEIDQTMFEKPGLITGILFIPVEEKPPVQIAWALERTDNGSARPSF